MKLGFIGLGVMGRPLAEHLLLAGHDLNARMARGLCRDDTAGLLRLLEE